jgi:hypothetical protein
VTNDFKVCKILSLEALKDKLEFFCERLIEDRDLSEKTESVLIIIPNHVHIDFCEILEILEGLHVVMQFLFLL